MLVEKIANVNQRVSHQVIKRVLSGKSVGNGAINIFLVAVTAMLLLFSHSAGKLLLEMFRDLTGFMLIECKFHASAY